MAHHPRKRNWYLFVASVLIITTLAVPLARVILPPIHRRVQLNQLSSPDAKIRAQGQIYLLRRALEPEVIEGAISRLNMEDDRAFLELAITLDQLGHWTRDRIPLDAWLRWLEAVAGDADDDERVRVMQLVAEMHANAGDARVQALFRRFTADQVAEVRYNALVCIAEMRGACLVQGDASGAAAYTKLMHSLTGDPSPQVARHAWLFLGLMKQSRLEPLTPAHLQVEEVAQALLWVAQQEHAQPSQAAIDALTSPDVSPQVRAMAAYTLGLSQQPAARDALIAFIDQGPKAVNDDNQVAFWRAILSLPLMPDAGDAPPSASPTSPPSVPSSAAASADPGRAALLRFLLQCTPADYENPSLRPLILACLFRERRLTVDLALKGSELVSIVDDPVAWLASIEGVPAALAQGRGQLVKTPPPAQVHDQIRLAYVRAMEKPAVADLLPLCLSESATVRDQACVIAAKRLSSEQVGELARILVKPVNLKGGPDQPVYRYDDGAKRSAAMLLGLTGEQPVLLRQMASDFGSLPGIIEIVQLGLWMQNQSIEGVPDMAARARQMLFRDDLPISTVLLALIHMKDPIGMEMLLIPRGDQNPRLLKLLDEERWWFVLEHYLPAQAPRLWVWADNELARFQLDLLRNWYVVNRHGDGGSSKSQSPNLKQMPSGKTEK